MTLSMIPKVFLLVEQIRPRTAQVDDLRTPIPILFQPRTFKAVERVGYALSPHLCQPLFLRAREGEEEAYLSAAYHALVLVVAEGAFVADADEGRRAHVAIADGAFAVAFVAETTDGDAGLLAAHYEIAVFGC